MTLEPQRSTRIGVGLDSRRGNSDPQAWKEAIGTNNRATARFTILTESKPRWKVLGLSAFFQFVVVAILFLIPLIYPEQVKMALNYGIMPLATPITELPMAPPPPPPAKIRPKIQPKVEVEPPPPAPLKALKILAPKPVQPVPPRPKEVEIKQPEFKPVLEEARLDTTNNMPKRPREEVKVGNLSSGSAAPATVAAAVNKVQTGGFGDPNGVPGPGNPNKRQNIMAQGSPLLPGGPGYGNGTGGAKGVRGTVASTGFGNSTAVPPPSGGKRGTVQQTSGFGDASAAPVEAPKKKAVSEDATTAVGILEKPQPVYTAEGRSLKVEGDVVIDLVFLASGQVQINRVVHGLGHGLDEAAVQAAKQIRFKPAKRDGQPVDYPARVRIEFRLAY
ncbi:MAG: TonB family protein [Acidobacteriia bacterium]|nr:TonB family protein [Terriglobia bacterium]